MTWPPGEIWTGTFPAGLAQLMFRAESTIGAPTAPEMVSGTGNSLDVTCEFVQLTAPNAFNRFEVIVSPATARASPLARIRFLMVRQSLVGSCAFKRAATPVT